MPARSAATFALAWALLVTPAAARTVPAEVWPMFQYAADHNAVFDQPSWDVSWKADIGDKTNGGLSIVGSTLYVESFDHRVYAIDALTGRVLWRRELPNVVMNTPVVVNGIVIAGTGQATLLDDAPAFWLVGRPQGDAVFGLDAATGDVRWRYDTVGENMPTGAYVLSASGPAFVFANGDDHVYGLNPATGALLWKQKTLGVDGMASLVESDGRVFGIATLGMSGFYEMQRNREAASHYWNWTWSLDPGRGGQYVWSVPGGVCDASPTVGDGLVFVQGFRLFSPRGAAAADRARALFWANLANTEQRFNIVVTAVVERTGKTVWSYVSNPGPNITTGTSSFTADALFASHVVYEPLPMPKEFAAFDSTTGKLLWKISTINPVKTSPVLKDGLLYFGDTGGHFYVVRARDGHLDRTLAFPGIFSKSPPIIVGTTMFIANQHYVYAIKLADIQRGTASPI